VVLVETLDLMVFLQQSLDLVVVERGQQEKSLVTQHKE
jgi:hypothetical protein